jgi:hypothetical protein
MKTTERFNRAYDALVKAFFEGTLAAGHCRACAVGNIVAGGLGFKIEKSALEIHAAYPTTIWVKGVRESQGCGSLNQDWPGCSESVIIGITGYSFRELLDIEDAFEESSIIKVDEYKYRTEQEILEDQFNGLCAVVDVLLKLDCISPDEKYNAKFREHPKLITHDH